MNQEKLDALNAAAMDIALGHVDRLPSLRPDGYEVDLQSGLGSRVLILNSQEPAVVKVYPTQTGLRTLDVLRESMNLAMLNEAPVAPPLAIPEPLELAYDLDRHLQYLVMSRLAGTILDYPAVRGMSSAEKLPMGFRVGEFAGWMATTLSARQYRQTLYETSADVYDRARVFDRFTRHLPAVRSIGAVALADCLEEVLQEFSENYGDLTRPEYIGHDDIRPTNMSFEPSGGAWRLTGIIDFAEMKPVSAAREFRHIRLLGQEFASAAIEGFGATTGKTVSMEEVDIWAKYQVTSGLTFAVAGLLTEDADAFNKRLGAIQELRPSLDAVYPQIDWSDLDELTEAYEPPV